MSSYIVVNPMPSPESCTLDKERRAFVIRSYALTIIFLVLTCGQVCASILVEEFRRLVVEQKSITYMGLSLFFFTILLFFNFRDVRVSHTCNSLISFVLVESVTAVIIILSITFIKFDAFIAFSIALILIIVGTLLAASAPFDLTKYVVLLMTFVLTLYIVCMITIFLAIFFMSWLLIIAFCAISLLGATIFLMYHTQLIIGGRSFYMRDDDHYFAGTILYVDSCIIFILTLCLYKPIEISYFQNI